MSASPAAEAIANLRSSTLFGVLGNDQLGALAANLRLQRFEAGKEVIREGDSGDACYIVRSGEAAVVSRDLIGQEVALGAFGPGDCFGEVALFTHRPRTATIRAQTNLEAYVLDRADFDRLAGADPLFAAHTRAQVEMVRIESFLKRASPFAQLPPETVRRLVPELRAQHASAGDVIVRQGEEADRFFLVRSGRVEVLQGQRRVRSLEAGDFFGEIGLMVASQRTATVRALEDTDLLVLSKLTFDALVRQHPTLSNLLAEFLHIRYRAAPGQSLVLPDPITTLMPFLESSQRERYWGLLLIGAAAFAGLSVLAVLVGGPLLMYGALVVGALVSPIVYLTYLFESQVLADRPFAIAAAFVLGAGLGLPLAMQLEQRSGAQAGQFASAVLVAVIEEAAKLLSVAWLLRRRASRFQLDGVIYGAAVGMGFAALETLLFGIGRLGAIGPLLVMLWLRALLAPFGHGTWTAIVGCVLWRKQSLEPRRWAVQVAAVFGLVVALHGIWDWQPLPGLSNVLLMMLVGGAGILILRMMIQRAATEELAAILALNPEVAEVRGELTAVRCRQCGQSAPRGSHYCARCGAVLKL